MPNQKDNIRVLMKLVSESQWRSIGTQEWSTLREHFPRISESTLRKTLAAMDLAIEQPWRGVDTHSLDGLEETLIALAKYYVEDPKLARAIVISAKDKARYAARNKNAAADKRNLKLEMVDWMLVWLGDPAIFATWVRLRRSQISREKPNQP
jgi:hypothetical protein